MDLKLKNLVALITAASDGLGFATALQLAKEGASVAICSRSLERLKTAQNNILSAVPDANITIYESDITNPNAVAQLIQQVVTHFGQLDLLMTNVGGPTKKAFADTTPKDWQQNVELVLFSAVNLIHSALPYLEKSAHASILTLTSVSAKQPIPGLLMSNVFRPAVLGLTKTLSQELGPKNIRVNSILPGWTATQRTQELLTPEKEQKVVHHIPLGRMGTPEEFANVATFLLSPAASYISGAMLQVDGGDYQGLF